MCRALTHTHTRMWKCGRTKDSSTGPFKVSSLEDRQLFLFIHLCIVNVHCGEQELSALQSRLTSKMQHVQFDEQGEEARWVAVTLYCKCETKQNTWSPEQDSKHRTHCTSGTKPFVCILPERKISACSSRAVMWTGVTAVWSWAAVTATWNSVIGGKLDLYSPFKALVLLGWISRTQSWSGVS